MSKYKHVIHSEKFLAELLKDEAAKKRYEEDYEKLLGAYYVVKMRKAAGMRQADLAQKLGTCQSVVARIEAGKQNLTLIMLSKIAKIFGKRLGLEFL